MHRSLNERDCIQIPRPRKLNRKDAYLETYGGIWNSSNAVAKGGISAPAVRTSTVMKPTKTEYYHVAPDNRTLTIRTVSLLSGTTGVERS